MHDTHASVRRWEHADGYRSQLIAQAQRRGLTREEAEDVASEAILRAGAKGDLELDRAENWLRRVTRNLAVDVHRARLTPVVVSRLAHVHDPAPFEPQTIVDDRLEACWVASLVSQLPSRQQLVLQHKAEDRSVLDIAAHLGVPYKTVESLASRARTKMREALATALGVIVLLGGWLRRVPRTSTAPVVLVAASTFALTVPLLPHVGGWDESAPTPRLLPVVDSASASGAVVDDKRLPPTSTRSDARPTGPSRTVQELVPPGQVGPVAHTGVKTTRRDPDRTILESVVDCLNGGVELSTENIGCAS